MLSGLRQAFSLYLAAQSVRGLASGGFAAGPRKIRKSQKPIDDALLPVLAILGKPNVGKSALFNRLVQRSEALVKNTPDDHVTRDYRTARGKLGDLSFRVVDTSGLEPFLGEDSIQGRATSVTISAIKDADAAVLLIDAREGLSHADYDLARWLQGKVGMKLFLGANKAEGSRSQGSALQDVLVEAHRLGLGEPIAISAATGEGMADLYQAVQPTLDAASQRRVQEAGEAPPVVEGEPPAPPTKIKIAILGLPNVGKSTLMNQLLGRVRSITGPEPGLTRDAVNASFEYKKSILELVDTAGWLNRSRLKAGPPGGDLAQSAQQQTQRAYNSAHVVVLVVDAVAASALELPLTRREVALASDVIREGRALIIALNKLDELPRDETLQALARVERQLQQQLTEVRGAACHGLSALTGEGVEELLPSVLAAYDTWNQRVNTSSLNKWLVRTAERHSFDGGANQIMRVRYVTQVATRPPSFVAFVSGKDKFADSSLKFLGNSLRQEFGFDGVPLRIDVRVRRKLAEDTPRWRRGPRRR